MALKNIELYRGLPDHWGAPDMMAKASGHLAKVRVGRSIRLARSRFSREINALLEGAQSTLSALLPEEAPGKQLEGNYPGAVVSRGANSAQE